MLPVLWKPLPEPEAAPEAPQESTMGSLLSALTRLTRRGEGSAAWAAPLVDDPIAFLLDATGDYVNVWGPTGERLYSNHPDAELRFGTPTGARVEELAIGQRHFQRRSLSFSLFDARYVVEVLRELRPAQ